jgi:L-threonylcarbamoyladenylate synthase
METKLTDSPYEAAEILKAGGLVAFPTETVYGLGANVFDEASVAKIFKAKRRPADNPLIAHVASFEQIRQLAAEVTETAEKLIEKFFPGPLTVVLKKSDSVPDVATAGLDSIGVRMPRNQIARDFLIACGTPVVAPSANLSGRPSPTTWQAVYEDLNGRIDCILQGDPTEIGLESTVVDCRNEVPIVLRLGAVSVEEIRSLMPGTKLLGSSDQAVVRSPGLRHKHYSPRARVKIFDAAEKFSNSLHADNRVAFIGLQAIGDHFFLEMVCSSIEEYAHSLFEFFRDCDRRNIDTIYCEAVEEVGIGAALMDRLRRAEAG